MCIEYMHIGGFSSNNRGQREKKNGKAKGRESCLQPVTLIPVDLPQGNVTEAYIGREQNLTTASYT